MGNCSCSNFVSRTAQTEIVTEPNRNHTDPSLYNLKYATLLDQIPDYSNENTRATLQSVGPFVYDDDDQEDKDLLPPQAYLLQDSSTYIGQWKDGLMHGRGRLMKRNGYECEGYWKKGRPAGKSRIILEDGYEIERFERNNADSVRILHFGAGAYIDRYYRSTDKKGGMIRLCLYNTELEGEIFGRRMNGQGTLKLSDGRVYKGEFKRGLISGVGMMIWPDGRKYVGEFANDQMHGYGIYEWPDGKKYKGNWENGKQHGRGVCISSNGAEKVGEWIRGKRTGWLKEKEETAD